MQKTLGMSQFLVMSKTMVMPQTLIMSKTLISGHARDQIQQDDTLLFPTDHLFWTPGFSVSFLSFSFPRMMVWKVIFPTSDHCVPGNSRKQVDYQSRQSA